MILNPSSVIMRMRIFQEGSGCSNSAPPVSPELVVLISCYDCPHYSRHSTQTRLGQVSSNILIKACFVSSNILSRRHIWIGEDS